VPETTPNDATAAPAAESSDIQQTAAPETAPTPAPAPAQQEQAQPTPEVEPAPEPIAQPEPKPVPDPVVAATLEVPPLESSQLTTIPAGEGGEWELLTGKVRAWLESGELQRLWAQARSPLTALAILIALLVVLRVYSALLGAIESLPLAPGLLELVGLIWLVRYGVPKLVRNSEREQLIGGLKQRWQAFLGKP
jgi:hypothetical protein